MKKPAVIFAPRSQTGMQKGFNQLADLLAATLGPTQGIVFSTSDVKPGPEILNDAATIARRIIALPDPLENAGLMLLRGLVWRMHERVGDGGATTAVLARTMLQKGVQATAAGANPVLVSKGILRAAKTASSTLGEMSQPCEHEDDLTAVALSVTGHERLSFILGEMFSLLGPLAHIDIEDFQAPYLEREYLDGGLWAASLASPVMMTAPGLHRAIQLDCQVALFDGALSTTAEVLPLLELAVQTPARPLLLAAHKISGEAVTVLASTHSTSPLKVIAVSLTRSGDQALADLNDLALLTGANVISPVMGRKLQNIRPADLGRARRVEADPEELLVSGGGGDTAGIHQQIEILSSQVKNMLPGEGSRADLEMRLGRLSGNIGVLKIGAYSASERSDLHQRASQAVKALRCALEEGVLPGGGTAFIHAIPQVKDMLGSGSPDEDMGIKVVAAALEAPFFTLLQNAGRSAPGVHMHEISSQPPGLVYDALTGKLTTARESGLLDAASVLKAAVETAASGTAMALQTGAVILKRNPRVSYEP